MQSSSTTPDYLSHRQSFINNNSQHSLWSTTHEQSKLRISETPIHNLSLHAVPASDGHPSSTPDALIRQFCCRPTPNIHALCIYQIRSPSRLQTARRCHSMSWAPAPRYLYSPDPGSYENVRCQGKASERHIPHLRRSKGWAFHVVAWKTWAFPRENFHTMVMVCMQPTMACAQAWGAFVEGSWKAERWCPRWG